MQVVAITAGIDANLSLVSWLIIIARRKALETQSEEVARMVRYFSYYFFSTFLFLALLAVAIRYIEPGTMQQIVIIVADLALWVSLVCMLLIALSNTSTNTRRALITILIILEAAGTLYQLLGLANVPVNVGSSLTYVLQNMGPLLMYVVWIPSAVFFLYYGLTTESVFVRTRCALFAAGLLFITLSWAFRLQFEISSVNLITFVSFMGFVLLLGGILVKQKTEEAPQLQL